MGIGRLGQRNADWDLGIQSTTLASLRLVRGAAVGGGRPIEYHLESVDTFVQSNSWLCADRQPVTGTACFGTGA